MLWRCRRPGRRCRCRRSFLCRQNGFLAINEVDYGSF
jgi:hypothetical protein